MYASYRFSPSLNLSAKYRYGSNFPIPGFFRMADGSLFLAEQENQLRIPAYSRLYLRLNKAFHYKSWKLTLYGEVINVLAEENIRYSDLGDVNTTTGRVFAGRDMLLPLLPIAGVSMEF